MAILEDVGHVVVGGGPDLVCHWPRQGGIWHWGDEILVAYIESPCEYKEEREVGHGQDGIWKRGYVRLRRSLDGGLTWSDAGKVFDNSLPLQQQRRVLHLDEYHHENITGHVGAKRESIDMSNPDAILIMGRAWCGDEIKLPDGTTARDNVTYCYRSPDRGLRWEEVPSIVWPNCTRTVVELANNTLKLGAHRLVCWVVGSEGIEGVIGAGTYSPQLYASEDDGVTWDFYTEVFHDATARIAASYPHVVALPSGRWLCFLGCWRQSLGCGHQHGRPRDIRWTSLCVSDDEGLNWSEPRRMHSWSVSPFPILLNDGRLVVIYMRRVPDPTGLYAIVSEDEGLHWSPPACIRDDIPACGPREFIDGGYPVAIQMDDGRIFTAYYWQHDDPDVPWYGGRKFIAGTFLRLE
jgi:hypothetical protein